MLPIIRSSVLSAAVTVAVSLAAVVAANAVAYVVVTGWAGYVVGHGIIIHSLVSGPGRSPDRSLSFC
jgi:hypothetical protein